MSSGKGKTRISPPKAPAAPGKVKMPELDKSQAEILGFAKEEGAPIQLQSLESGRIVEVLVRCAPIESHSSWGLVQMEDPPHDPNKLHGSLSGLPRDETHRLDMEDLGVETRTLESVSKAKGIKGEVLSTIIGDAWLKGATPTKALLGRSRILIAQLSKKGEWSQRILGAASDFLSAFGGFDVPRIVAACPEAVEAQLLVPILQPKRVVDEKGRWYFVG